MPDFDFATVGDNCIDRYLPPIGLSRLQLSPPLSRYGATSSCDADLFKRTYGGEISPASIKTT